jgi:soluble lytic murein transglycosylase-like protein
MGISQGIQHTFATLGLFIVSLIAPNVPKLPSHQGQSVVLEYRHIVKSGESLTDIARISYGSQEYWTTVWNDNPAIINPDLIQSGFQLKIRSQKPLLVERIQPQLLTRALQQFPLAPTADQNAGNSAVPVSTASLPVQQSTSGYDEVYKQAAAKFGVPWQVLYGIHLTEPGLRDGPIANGGGSGAQGPMQFMPGTWAAYAVDGNGDGIADINNATDAINTAANYIAQHGGVTPALQSYGGNINGTLAAACEKGYCE